MIIRSGSSHRPWWPRYCSAPGSGRRSWRLGGNAAGISCQPRAFSMAVAAHRARMDQIEREIAAIPIVNRRSTNEIVDDLNAL